MVIARTAALRKAAALCAAITAVAPPVSEAYAQQATDYFRGKTIMIVVGTGEGGPYSLSAQLLARHWAKNIPGQPNVVVQSMPGGGGLKMAGWLQNVAPRDGTVIGMPVQTAAMSQMIEPRGVMYDVRAWKWIGNMAVLRQSVVVSANAPARSMEDARKIELIIGATQTSGNLFTVPKLAKELAGAKFKIILGYTGAADLDKAMAGGEIQGRGGTWSDWKLLYPDWEKGDRIVPMFLTGMERDPATPNIPVLRELVDNPLDKQVVDFFGQTDLLGRPFAAPPGTPQQIVDVLRDSFTATVKDPAMIEDARNRHWSMEPTDWRQVEASANDTLDVAPSVVARMKEVIAR